MLLLLLFSLAAAAGESPTPPGPWLHPPEPGPPAGAVVEVRTEAQLQAAVEGNIIVNCRMGIRLGIVNRMKEKGFHEHEGGVIRNNIVWREAEAEEMDNFVQADAKLFVNAAAGDLRPAGAADRRVRLLPDRPADIDGRKRAAFTDPGADEFSGKR